MAAIGTTKMTRFAGPEPRPKHLKETIERHAPDGFDPESDDMTVEFAIKLAEQDREIARLRAALAECAADFKSRPGTMMSCANELGTEFQRRLNLAAEALAYLP